MKKSLVVAGAVITVAVVSGVIAFSQTDEPVLDPDPQVNAVMTFIGIKTPPTHLKDRELMRSHYAYLPELKPGMVLIGSGGPPLSMPLLPEGSLGTKVRLRQPDDAVQKTVGDLLAAQPVPTERTAHFASVLKEVAFLGWFLDIQSVETAKGTTTVTVVSCPLIRTREGNGGNVLNGLTETWEVKEQTAKLVATKARGAACVFDGH